MKGFRQLILALIALLVPSTGHAEEPSEHWYYVTMDRQNMLAFNVSAQKLGLSGALTMMATATAEPEPNLTQITLALIEFDCFAKRFRILRTGHLNRDGTGPGARESKTPWGPVGAQTNMETMQRVACEGASAIPDTWIDAGSNLAIVTEFYFERVLGLSR